MKKQYKPTSLRPAFSKRCGVFSKAVLLMLMAPILTCGQIRLVADFDQGYTPDYYPMDFMYMTAMKDKVCFVYENRLFFTSDGTPEGTLQPKTFPSISNLRTSSARLFFNADDGVNGSELWVWDGTSNGMMLLKDIMPGGGSSSPEYLTDVEGTLFFVADDGVHGRELWKSDGTPDGTVMVRDIFPGSSGGSVGGFRKQVALNGNLVFSADDGTTGAELWISDGTEAGTQLLKDINQLSGSSPEGIVNANGQIFFVAVEDNVGRQLWRSDGTSAGTMLVKTIGTAGANYIDKLTAVGGTVFFQADDGIHGIELWKSDGSPEGTQIVKDLTPGPGSENYEDQDGEAHLSSLTNIYGRLFFLAVANGSLALWVSDGSDEGTIRLTYGNVDFTWIMPYFIEYDGQAYFVAYEGSIPFGDGMGLFKSDGTVEGTQLVKADVGESLINSAQLTTMGNKIYLFGYSNLWKSDGTPEGTVVVKEFRTPRGSFPQWLTDLSGTLFFTTANEAFAFRATDGTPENTRMLNDMTYAQGLRNVNGKLFFSGRKSTEPESSLHMELYASDGTDEGTVLIKDIEPDGNSDPSGFTAFPGGVMFAAQTSVAGRELWKTDGTASGTVQVSDINPASGSSTPDALTGVSGKVFFKAHNGSVGEELWISRGLGRNTHLVKDIYPGAPSSQLSNLIAFKGNLYFIANDGAHGFELWRSNGKSSGSRMVKDMRTGDAETGMDFGNVIKSDQAMYYSGLLQNGKSSLIKSTGTSYGTTVLKQFESNVPGSMVGSIGHDAFVMIRFPGYSELWKTTGKASGTTKLITMDGEEAHRPDDHAVLNGILYFSSRSSDGSHKLWRTDGTIPGTYYFNLEGAPMYLTASGQRVFFSGDFYETGRELYVIEEASSATILTKASSRSGNSDSGNDQKEVVIRYPNPFTSSLTLMVNGNNDEYFNLNVIQTDGKILDRRFGLPCNITHTMGANWPAGMYILQIEMRGRMMTTKVIKTR